MMILDKSESSGSLMSKIDHFNSLRLSNNHMTRNKNTDVFTKSVSKPFPVDNTFIHSNAPSKLNNSKSKILHNPTFKSDKTEIEEPEMKPQAARSNHDHSKHLVEPHKPISHPPTFPDPSNPINFPSKIPKATTSSQPVVNFEYSDNEKKLFDEILNFNFRESKVKLDSDI